MDRRKRREEESAGLPDTARPTLGGAGEDDPLLTVAQCAQRAGMVPGAWRNAVSSGRVPAAEVPDGPGGRLWRASTVDAYLASRTPRGRYMRRHVVPFSGELR